VYFLDEPARAAFKQAVEAVENASAVEVVVAVRKKSARYLHANAIAGVVAVFVGLAVVLYSSHPFGLASILIDPFVLGLAVGAAVELLPGLKRVLSPNHPAAVARAARATFVERNIHTTTGRSGLLVYISWLERRVALVADVGLLRALPDDVLARAEADLTAAVSRGGAEVARALEALAPRLARAMPHRDDDVNELPDAIDEGS